MTSFEYQRYLLERYFKDGSRFQFLFYFIISLKKLSLILERWYRFFFLTISYIFLPFKKCLYHLKDGAEHQFYYPIYSLSSICYSWLFALSKDGIDDRFLFFQLFALVLFICLNIGLEMALILKSLLYIYLFLIIYCPYLKH